MYVFNAFIFPSTLTLLDSLSSHQNQNPENDTTQLVQLPGGNQEASAARPQRQKQSTYDNMAQLSEMISAPANRGSARGQG